VAEEDETFYLPRRDDLSNLERWLWQALALPRRRRYYREDATITFQRNIRFCSAWPCIYLDCFHAPGGRAVPWTFCTGCAQRFYLASSLSMAPALLLLPSTFSGGREGLYALLRYGQDCCAAGAFISARFCHHLRFLHLPLYPFCISL